MVHGNVKKALNLGGVKIESENPIRPSCRKQVGHDLGRDRHTPLVLAVLARVTVVGQHGGDAGGAGALKGVEDDEQFHQIRIHRRTGRLDDVDVAAAHVLVNADEVFAVGKVIEGDLAEAVAEATGDGVAERDVGAAAEDFELAVIVQHGARVSDGGTVKAARRN